MTRISDVLAIGALALVATGCNAISNRNAARYPNAPTAAERVVTQGEANASQPSEVVRSRQATTLYDGEWEIIETGRHKVNADEETPYINFSGKEGRFYASNGCNIINGVFGVQGNSITFGDVITTRMLCPEIPYIHDIAAVLRDGVTVNARIDDRGGESILTLSQQGKVVLKLCKHNLERLDGEWMVTRIGDTKMSDPQLNIFFDSNEHTIHGNTGCNYFNGVIEQDGAQPCSISFSKMSVTMRACPNADVERLLLVALEETSTYKLDGDRLSLLGPGGSHLMALKRVLKTE